MKKIILFSLILLSTTFSVTAQEVPQVQKTLLSKISATWCPNCGTWGWSMWDGVVADNTENATLMAVHHSGELKTATSEALANNFEVFSQPRFYLNNTDKNVGGGNATSKRVEIKDEVNANNSVSPVVNAGLNAYLVGTQLSVDTKTKFFQATSGEYYVGAYVVEDLAPFNQTGVGSNALHKRLLRTAVGADHFGQLVVNGDANINDEFTHQFSMDVSSDWNLDNIEIVTIVWVKIGNTYMVVNTHSTDELLAPSSTKNLAKAGVSMQLAPTIVDQEVKIDLNLKEGQENIDLILVNQLGQEVLSIFQGNLSIGTHQFEIDRSQVNQSGLYFITARNENGILTKKVIFQ